MSNRTQHFLSHWKPRLTGASDAERKQSSPYCEVNLLSNMRILERIGLKSHCFVPERDVTYLVGRRKSPAGRRYLNVQDNHGVVAKDMLRKICCERYVAEDVLRKICCERFIAKVVECSIEMMLQYEFFVMFPEHGREYAYVPSDVSSAYAVAEGEHPAMVGDGVVEQSCSRTRQMS